MSDKLKIYKEKRSENKTPEPFGGESTGEKLVFVIQKHRATALHYDFRLEVDGVMPSWAVPKGPSLDPTVKRLAMQTEDHPLDYRHFEGQIPEGEYGAGDVIIWDQGTYFPEIEVPDPRLKVHTKKDVVRVQVKNKEEGEKAMLSGIKKGEVKFFLKGKRLKGSFALVKTGFGGKNAWLLIKHRDEYAQAGYDAARFPNSVASNRELKT